MLRVFVVVSVLASCCCSTRSEDFELKPTSDLRWYRGNMHTHSLWSDGDDYPEMIADWYKPAALQLSRIHGPQRSVAGRTLDEGCKEQRWAEGL